MVKVARLGSLMNSPNNAEINFIGKNITIPCLRIEFTDKNKFAVGSDEIAKFFDTLGQGRDVYTALFNGRVPIEAGSCPAGVGVGAAAGANVRNNGMMYRGISLIPPVNSTSGKKRTSNGSANNRTLKKDKLNNAAGAGNAAGARNAAGAGNNEENEENEEKKENNMSMFIIRKGGNRKSKRRVYKKKRKSRNRKTRRRV
jgi:hypothetical protein